MELRALGTATLELVFGETRLLTDPAFDPPYTTVHTGVIQGGTALNIVPKDCWFDFEFRYLPGTDPHKL